LRAITVLGLLNSNGMAQLAAPGLTRQIDYNFDVRPILSDNCFRCHGHDEGSRRAGLRLDLAESAYAQALVPGKPQESELIRRVTSKDPAYHMPPPETHKSLSEAEISILTKWIEQGAVYKPHWAFVAPKKVNPPETKFRDLVVNPIDQFVFGRLEREGLHPSPEADRETLINRLSLTLTGLPPTLEEVDTFLRDKSSNAYEKVVDRLLASSAYGEHLAGYWMDIARYSETDGFLDDKHGRLFSPYRDWVISAFSKNMPYDQFGLWQVAGDLLPNATKEQKLATAFLRVGKRTTENGAIDEEYRVEYALDRANTIGAGFLGLTTGCARCHDHKYDPISQKDYYSLVAFFNSTDEPGWNPIGPATTGGPTIAWSSPTQDAELAALQAKIGDAQQTVDKVRKAAYAEAQSRASAMLAGPASQISESIEKALLSATEAYYPFDAVAPLPTGEMPKIRRGPAVPPLAPPVEGPSRRGRQRPQIPSGQQGQPASPPLGDLNLSKLAYSPSGLEGGEPAVIESALIKPGKKGTALYFDETNLGFLPPYIGSYERTQEFSVDIWVRPAAVYENALVVSQRDNENAGRMGYELRLEKNHVGFGMIHLKPHNMLHVVSKKQIPTDQWTHVAITYDGSSKAGGVQIYLDGQPAEIDIDHDSLTRSIMPVSGPPAGPYADFYGFQFGYRFREVPFTGGAIDELRIFNRELSPLEVDYLHKGLAALQKDPSELGHEIADWIVRNDANVVSAEKALSEARDEQNKLISVIPEVMVMGDTLKPRPSYVLERGVYSNHGAEVQPEGLSAIYPWNGAWPRNRIGLAKWMFDPGNPLTARVFVNQMWQLEFGRGIVETAGDFGTQGTLPSHPKLLDWLAVDFVDSGWDVKRLLKMMAMSAAYRQSSEASAELSAKDPKNMLLARGPRLRMSAEQIRDNALAVSGLLVRKVGGPSVYPYQPEGVWLPGTLAVPYPQPDDQPAENQHRRSLYTFVKRNIPPPSMEIFDLQERHATVVRRQTSNTPLQALVLLDDPQYVEAFRVLAANAIQREPDLTARITLMFRMATRRRPTSEELAVLAKQYEQEKAIFEATPENATKLVHVGVTPVPQDINLIDLAATTQVAAAIMNSPDAYSVR
jgi:hypothetical protein